MSGGLLAAVALTGLAGLATGLGGVLVLAVPGNPRGVLAASLGFSAGVMVWIAFVDLYPESQRLLASQGHGEALPAALFLLGMVAVALLDLAVPERDNPHVVGELEVGRPAEDRELSRMGVLTAVAIALHNFPEGIATFFATLHDPVVGATLALAVGLHNLPEGIAVAMPLYRATGKRGRAIAVAFLSGLAEPLGGLLAWALFRPFVTDALLGALFAAVAGVMVFLSLDQLLPNAKRYDAGHASVYGLVAGVAAMAFTLAWR